MWVSQGLGVTPGGGVTRVGVSRGVTQGVGCHPQPPFRHPVAPPPALHVAPLPCAGGAGDNLGFTPPQGGINGAAGDDGSVGGGLSGPAPPPLSGDPGDWVPPTLGPNCPGTPPSWDPGVRDPPTPWDPSIRTPHPRTQVSGTPPPHDPGMWDPPPKDPGTWAPPVSGAPPLPDIPLSPLLSHRWWPPVLRSPPVPVPPW